MNWNELIKSKELQPSEVDVVIYHDPCSDGCGSAFVAWKYFSEMTEHKEVLYYPTNHGTNPPDNLEGKNVLICDFSYRKNIINELLLKVNKLLIIDHHKSAEADLKDLEDKYKIFNMEHSGAMLTWYYFYPEIEPPLLIKYIQDRDIWTKKLPGTDDFASWFFTRPLEFEEFNKYLNDQYLLEMIQTKGVSYGELNNFYTCDAMAHVVPKFCKIKDKYYIIGYVNSSILKSDIGNKIFDKFPLIDFSAVYSISDSSDKTLFSLRSTEYHVDVSEIAFGMGGGGHRNASGVRVDYVTNHLPGQVYDNGQIYKLMDKIYFDNITIHNQSYRIAYLNTNNLKYELCSYLSQFRYFDKLFNRNMTEIENILRIKQNEELDIINSDVVNVVAVWDYNPITNTTNYLLSFINEEDLIKEVFNRYNLYTNDNKYFSFSIEGFLKKIDI